MTVRRSARVVHVLAGSTPDLPGALCRGRWHLFDPAGHGEVPESVTTRQAQAVALCSSCPALAQCHAWILTEPRRLRQGVVAGHIYSYKTSKDEADD
ncbi:WhiB family transcriptional regulator [Rhodococcus sp. 06-221-2]|uniref:WhiB family transcriptional regulator n=1 Tax=Rhodococcus sp. 06-221-2 TaxID=2022514 RepID=UPI00211AEC82|nr:WhiB family transcriptional regulator [Rhodococcus sp. 06-221-2]